MMIAAAENIITKMTTAVANTNFIANSRAAKEAGRLANLLKNLNLNALIVGERGVGKLTLALNILDANVVDGSDLNAVLNAISSNSALIIRNFHKISNYIILKEALSKEPTRIIATASKKIDESIADTFFGLKISIPPLSERPEDINALAQKFLIDAKELFISEAGDIDIDLEKIPLNLSQNAYSLRQSVYIAFISARFKEKDILNLLEKFLIQRLGSGDDYRKLLYLFDVPLLKAGFKKFRSQLAISKNFGLNRNTLRKKISELHHFFKSDEYKF
ncbi:MAG: Fis family transcriptional regulator [Campylobacteraceae bacterium]|jgi:transcriptional regulator of acetoin/glycerol metabolism|nr:Fis family transcriptional regulator [Campylobacteraceae bacterium]